MTLIDKIFRIGLLVLAFGFLAVYAYYKNPAHAAPDHARYVVKVGPRANGHIVYLADTRDGIVFYAERTGATDDQPLTWKTSQPQTNR
jgi:hypothetical protein